MFGQIARPHGSFISPVAVFHRRWLEVDLRQPFELPPPREGSDELDAVAVATLGFTLAIGP
ncbi:MAG: hypothetical protein JO287_06975 [Pseudonocardiales bacterium]|nr:hypothetical protein [Pseudonocardiales bacterium]